MDVVFSSDEDEEVLPQSKRTMIGVNGHSMDLEDMVDGRPHSKHQLQRIISIEEDHLPQLLQQGYQAQLREWSEDEELEEGMDLQMSNIYPTTSTPTSVSPPPGVAPTPTSPRGQPVGKETVQSVRKRLDLVWTSDIRWGFKLSTLFKIKVLYWHRWGTFNIHGTFPLRKRFFIVE